MMKITLEQIDKDLIDIRLHVNDKIVKGNTWQSEVFPRIDKKDMELIIKFIQVGINHCLESVDRVDGKLNFIERLLAKIELTELVERYVPLRKKSGDNYFACCPFHPEKTPSFCVSKNDQFYYCYSCGAHGNAIDFLMKYKELDFLETIRKLSTYAGMEIPDGQEIK